MPIKTLKHEHEVVQLVLAAAEREGRAIHDTGRIRPETVAQMLDFFQGFLDRCHHSKEERHFFPRLERHSLPHEAGALAELRHDHYDGRRFIQGALHALPQAAAGDPAARASVGDYLLAYVALLKKHIKREETILFPLADELLTPEDRSAILEAFEQVETIEMGAGAHEKYHRLAHELAKK